MEPLREPGRRARDGRLPERNDERPNPAEGMMRWYADLGRMWLDCLAAYVPGADSMLGGRAASGGTVSVEVEASNPVRVSIELFQSPGELSLEASPLRSGDRSRPPITDVHLRPGRPGTAPVLQVRVPAGHPPETYTGTLWNPRNDQEVGRITVCVLPDGERGSP